MSDWKERIDSLVAQSLSRLELETGVWDDIAVWER